MPFAAKDTVYEGAGTILTRGQVSAIVWRMQQCRK